MTKASAGTVWPWNSKGSTRAPRADPGGRVLAQGLLEDHLQLGQLAAHQLLGGGRPPCELGILLGEQARDDLRGGGRARRT